MKNLVYKNQKLIDTEYERLARLKPFYNEFREAWNELEINDFSIKHLQSLKERGFNDVSQMVEHLVKSHIEAGFEQPAYGKFKMKKSEITKQLEIPDYSKLVEIVQRTTDMMQGYPTIKILIYSEYFEDSKEDGIIIDEKRFKKEVVDKNTVYAESEKELKTLDALKKLRDAVEQVQQHLPNGSVLVYTGGFKNEVTLKDIFYSDGGGQISINPEFFKKLTV